MAAVSSTRTPAETCGPVRGASTSVTTTLDAAAVASLPAAGSVPGLVATRTALVVHLDGLVVWATPSIPDIVRNATERTVHVLRSSEMGDEEVLDLLHLLHLGPVFLSKQTLGFLLILYTSNKETLAFLALSRLAGRWRCRSLLWRRSAIRLDLARNGRLDVLEQETAEQKG